MGCGSRNADTLLGMNMEWLYSDTMVLSALPSIPSYQFLGFFTLLLMSIVSYTFTEL